MVSGDWLALFDWLGISQCGRLLTRLRQDDTDAALAELRARGWLTNGRLQGAYLRGVDLHFEDLHDADLRGADLSFANLWDTNLQNARLGRARLWRADLEQADLRGADLREADLEKAILWGAILPDGDRWHTGYDMTRFTDAASDYYGEPPAYASRLHHR
ncbi:MAG: pentapeptide repeat-containing protein [Anaerolineales bacterium]